MSYIAELRNEIINKLVGYIRKQNDVFKMAFGILKLKEGETQRLYRSVGAVKSL